MSEKRIEYINLTQKFVVSSDNDCFPVTHLFNGDGDETDIPEETAACVAGPDSEGLWWTIPVGSRSCLS